MQEKDVSKFDTKLNHAKSRILELFDLDKLTSLFGTQTFLIGGAVRDSLLGKNTGDLDFMTRTNLEEIVLKLKEFGYVETQDSKEKNLPKKYYIKRDLNSKNITLQGGVLSFVLDGKEVQVGYIGDLDMTALVNNSDLNINCCAFSFYTRQFVNPNFAREILDEQIIRFLKLENVKNDPHKIFNALKQISRFPQLKVEEDSLKIIKESIGQLILFVNGNPNKKGEFFEILKSINGGYIVELFEMAGYGYFVKNVDGKPEKIKVDPPFISKNISELSPTEIAKISFLVKKQFGKRFDTNKLFNNKVNSIVYYEDENREITACCLMSGERIYTAASLSQNKIIDLVSSLCKCNYNVYTTISIESKLLIKMSQKAGLKLVNDPVIIRRILESQYPEYRGRVIIDFKNNYFVFTKIDSDDKPQVLLLS